MARPGRTSYNNRVPPARPLAAPEKPAREARAADGRWERIRDVRAGTRVERRFGTLERYQQFILPKSDPPKATGGHNGTA